MVEKKVTQLRYFMLLLLYCTIYNTVFSQDYFKADTIINTKISPYDQIGFQLITRERNYFLFKTRPNFKSTGFLIGRNFILTAAHNIYSTKNSRVKNIVISFGRYNDTQVYDKIELEIPKKDTTLIKFHPLYKWGHRDYDIGLIYIPDSIIVKVDKWPVNEAFKLENNFSTNDSIYLAGYPSEERYDGSLMIFDKGKIEQLMPSQIAHSLFTEKGSSGSPIWIEKKGLKKVIGIHTYTGIATRLSDDVTLLIKQWMRIMKTTK